MEMKMINAYILGKVEPNQEKKVLTGLKSITGIKSADITFGQFDFIARIEAKDLYGNTNSKTVLFNISDTSLPRLELSPDIAQPKTVYFSDYHITGFTDPSLQVRILVYDGNGSLTRNYSLPGGQESLPKQDFSNKPVERNRNSGDFPKIGDSYVFFTGPHDTLQPGIDYIEFSNHNRVPRYSITDTTVVYGPCNVNPTCMTRISINPPLEQNVNSGVYTASVYNSPNLTGWFDQFVELNEGINVIDIIAEKPNGKSRIISRTINYVSSGLNIMQKSPSSGAILGQANFSDSVTIRVTTDYPAFCNLTNVGNKVAKQFNYQMDRSGNGKEFSKTIVQGDCTSAGGSFCYINNDGTTPSGVYHRYIVKCSPDGLVMGSDQEEICFGIRTWYSIGQTEYGNNICDGSTGCVGNLPEPCLGVCTPTTSCSAQGKVCGTIPDGCGGTLNCGTCGPGQSCQGGQCVSGCTASCSGKQCGDDGCGGSCGSCQSGQSCEDGQCIISGGGAGGEHD